MKISTIIISFLFTLGVYGQETETKPEFDGYKWQPPYSLPAPKDWAGERLLIPISFAPVIPYKGVEDILFSPGWAKAKSEEYWSYAFLWYLEGEIRLSDTIINKHLKDYYTGLIKTKGPKIPSEKLIPVMTDFKEVKAGENDLITFAGTIYMLDYMKQNPITLNCKVHVRSCPGEDRTFVFFELSPQPLSHKIWLSLDDLWRNFKCKVR